MTAPQFRIVLSAGSSWSAINVLIAACGWSVKHQTKLISIALFLKEDMMLNICGTLYCLGVVVFLIGLVILFKIAPRGYEDESGFHVETQEDFLKKNDHLW